MVVKILDQTGAGKITNEISVTFSSERLTVKDIIEARVSEEVALYNKKLPDYFSGLIQPAAAESTLNGYRMKDRKKIDAEKQIYVALNAFLKNGFFMLIDNKQVESLEQEVLVSSNTSISFVKLTPLVGG
jgi:hypothetical protein